MTFSAWGYNDDLVINVNTSRFIYLCRHFKITRKKLACESRGKCRSHFSHSRLTETVVAPTRYIVGDAGEHIYIPMQVGAS